MRRGLALVLAVLAIAPATANAGPATRSIWVWDDPASGDVADIAAAGFNTVYLWVPTGSAGSAAHEAFVSQARSFGLEVAAVGGDPAWATDSGAWRTWAQDVERAGTFDAAVVNVEPYLHPSWNRQQTRVVRSYLRGISAANRQLSIPLHVTVPFWFDEIGYRSSSVLEETAQRSDGIVVLAYRDHAEGVDGILDISHEEIQLGAALGKPVIVGVETGPVTPEKVTFFEEGRAVLDAELQIVRDTLSNEPSFAGTAVHHWASFVGLAP